MIHKYTYLPNLEPKPNLITDLKKCTKGKVHTCINKNANTLMPHSPLSRFTITIQLTPTATLNVSMIKVKKHFWKNERKPECNKNSFHGFGRRALLLTSHEGRHCRYMCASGTGKA